MEPTATSDSYPTVENNPPPPPSPSPSPSPSSRPVENHVSKIISTKKKKKLFKDITAIPSTSSVSFSYFGATQRITRVTHIRRAAKVVFPPVRRGGSGGGGSLGDCAVEAIALPLGMSFAAVVAQVLERKDAAGERMSVDHLSMICTSAVRESLANVFDDRFDLFIRNFEKSFGSTLRTLRLINESSINKGACNLNHLNVENSSLDATLNKRVSCTFGTGIKNCHSEEDFPSVSAQNQMHIAAEEENTLSTDCLNLEPVNVSTDCLNRELALHGQMNQLACTSSSLSSVINQLGTTEKSVLEQVRSNDLRTLEIGLTMKKLKLKEAQLALNLDSNHLERSKLAMGRSKASFKTEKFKNQLEDTRHAELLKKCIDCLAAGLFIMSASLLYAAYVYSYKRITEAAALCALPEESKSWWIPRSVSWFNSGLHTLRCQVQVFSRMVFGILMILAIAYLLVQRSSTSQQTMPVTFMLLLLGAVCGFAGKLCVDTLGGSGLQWLLYWETLCLLHFFSNVCTSTLFRMLYGPVHVSQGIKQKAIYPYWCRQYLFYAVALLFLPLLCGLLPFASASEWKDHFSLLAFDFLSRTDH